MSKLNKLATAISVPILVGTIGVYGDGVNAASQIQVACENRDSIPTITATLSNPERPDGAREMGSRQTEILFFLPEYFSSEEAFNNCEKTAVSLQSYYDRGVMNYLASDTLDGKPVICAVERRGVRCDGYSSEVLFSLNKTVNPSQLLYDMLGGNFKDSQLPASRTVSRIYTDLRPRWWPF